MSDYELLKATKITYNYIEDILKNSEVELDVNKVNKISDITEILNQLYDIAYSNIENDKNKEEQLVTDACCKDCNNNLLISDNIDYSYQCKICDENYYAFEAITDNIWYEDERKEYLKLPSSFRLDIYYDKNKGLMYIGTENSSGVKYQCNDTKDFIKNIGIYCDNYLSFDDEKEVEL